MRRYEPPAGSLGRGDIDWDALVQLHAPRLRRRVAQRVSDPAAVEDVVQETFVQAYRRWETYDQTRPIWPWLVAIAINLGWRRAKAENRAETETDDVLVELPLPDYIGAGSDDHVANLDRRTAMRIALDGMTGKHRRALLRWELERRSAAELAASEGMTPEELRATVVRARKNLRQRYLAVVGEGPFAGGVLVGLGGLAARWRERLSRFASSGGWAEAAGAFAAAPAVAVAGMAMITLAPAPTPDAPPVGSLAGEPIAYVREVADGAATSASADATGAGSSQADGSKVGATTGAVEPAAPTLAAGPASANLATSANAHRNDLSLDKPNGETTTHETDAGYECEGIVLGAVCQVSGLMPAE